MNPFLQTLNKYFLLLAFSAGLNYVWGWIQFSLPEIGFMDHSSIYSGISLLIQLIIGVWLLKDAQRLKSPYPLLTALMGFLFPLLGVVIFALIWLGQNHSATAHD